MRRTAALALMTLAATAPPGSAAPPALGPASPVVPPAVAVAAAPLGLAPHPDRAAAAPPALASPDTVPNPEAPLAGALQAVVVTTADWDSVPGSLQRYARASASGPWQKVGAPIQVVVGKSGLGWGIGLHGDPPARSGPVKREGDGRSPAGVFRIGPAFGWAPAADVPWIHMPYLHLTDAWKCPDDVASSHYNQVLDEGTVRKDWDSHEDMRIDAYRLGAVVEHNWDGQRRKGAGSCIFLHIWGGPGSSTVGCTAMAPSDIEALLRWLDPREHPALVQLPREQYASLRTAWKLP